MRSELARATLGALDRYRIDVEDDVQLNAALDQFPQAQKLWAAAAMGHATGAGQAEEHRGVIRKKPALGELPPKQK